MPRTSPLEELISRFRALRHRNFRLYWSGQLVSVVGTWMQSVAQGWLMHRLTGSAFMLGLLAFMQFLPVMLLSLWAGVVADRVDKRRMLIAAQTGAMLQAVVLATLVSLGMIQAWMLIVLAFVFGLFNAFEMPTRQAFLVELVGKEDLSNAIALNSAGFNTARIVGPAIAGVLVATAGEGACFWINALSFLAVIASLFSLRLEAPTEEQHAERRRASLMDGVRYAWSVGPLRNLLLLLAVSAGLGFQYMVLLPVYARDILHAGAQGYGLMVSAFGVGSLFSAVLMTRRLNRWALRRHLQIGLTAAGVGMVTFAWSRALPLTLFMGFLAGFGLILYVASTNTLLQLTTEDRYRGRIMSLYTLMFIGTAPIGALVVGAVAQRWGAPIATTCSSSLLLGGAVWITWRLRVIAAREAARGVARSTQPPVTEKLG